MDNVNERLEALFKDAFGVEKVTDEMSIETVEGWDSMAHVGLILALQKEFGVSISPMTALDLSDVGAIRHFLADYFENRS